MTILTGSGCKAEADFYIWMMCVDGAKSKGANASKIGNGSDVLEGDTRITPGATRKEQREEIRVPEMSEVEYGSERRQGENGWMNVGTRGAAELQNLEKVGGHAGKWKWKPLSDTAACLLGVGSRHLFQWVGLALRTSILHFLFFASST